MAYKDILVHLDGSPDCSARVLLAASLAREHKAHLTGLYVVSHAHYQPEDEGAEADSAAVRADFQARTAEAGVSAECLTSDAGVSGVASADILIGHAYHKDLVVVGIHGDIPERVARGAGCPVLVVPRNGTFGSSERILVAWRNGRESARALKDAIPFLEKAAHVTVLEVTAPGEANTPTSAAEACRYLERHGIKAAADVVAAEIAVGDMLINEAWEERCDLLVMGALSNGAKGGLKFGAVARHVFDHMPVPVLISH